MIEFTNDELLAISNWAMDAADKEIRRKLRGSYNYEMAEAIAKKVHNEYWLRTKGQS